MCCVLWYLVSYNKVLLLPTWVIKVASYLTVKWLQISYNKNVLLHNGAALDDRVRIGLANDIEGLLNTEGLSAITTAKPP